MIEPPDISWLGILPELILGLGAALILLIDVQWKPSQLMSGGSIIPHHRPIPDRTA